jgi:hypothetical protein
VSKRSQIDDLNQEQRHDLIARLYATQEGLCYICERPIGLQVHKTDIDHIIALDRNGPDTESNWGLTHASCNRAKGNRDLQLQRHIATLNRHVEKYTTAGDEGPNPPNFTLYEALQELVPERQEAGARFQGDRISLSFTEQGEPRSIEYPIVTDKRSGFRSFVGMVPTCLIHHDRDTNPRSIVDLEPMIEEFYRGNPQLQPSLARLEFTEPEGTGQILLFDGQHKAAAQLYVGNNSIFTRVFINPDYERLKQVNFRAHTKLAQIHFPQLISDRVGHDLFTEGFARYLTEADRSKKSERSFLAEAVQSADRSEVRNNFQSFLRYEVLTGEADGERSQILSFVETVSARSRRYPLSYETLRKTFLGRFLYLKEAAVPLEESERFRQSERGNLIKLMNLFVDEILAHGRFDLLIGIYKMEERLVNEPESIPDSHLRAYRLCRASAAAVWIEQLRLAVSLLLNARQRYQNGKWQQDRPLWAEIQREDWESIRKMLRAIAEHKVWIVRVGSEVLSALASTRQMDWQELLLEGRLPGREKPIFPKLDQNFIFQAGVS